MKTKNKLLLLRNVLRAMRNDKSQNKLVARCALSVVLVKTVVFLIVLTSFYSSPSFAEDSIMKTLSAHVAEVAEDNSSLEVDFKHPATEEVQRLTFYVDDQTGLSGFEKLRDLRSGQVVNIDYVEGAKHRLLIRRIARVKLSGPPAGLENFRGL